MEMSQRVGVCWWLYVRLSEMVKVVNVCVIYYKCKKIDGN